MDELEKLRMKLEGFTDDEIQMIALKLAGNEFRALIVMMIRLREFGVSLQDIQQAWKYADIAQKREQ